MTNKIIIGSGDYYLDQLVKIIAAYEAKGYPAVVFAQPKVRVNPEDNPYIWLYRFFGLNFEIVMPVLPSLKSGVDHFLANFVVVMDTLCDGVIPDAVFGKNVFWFEIRDSHAGAAVPEKRCRSLLGQLRRGHV